MASADDSAEVVTDGTPATVTGVRGWKIRIAASWKTAAASILTVAKDLVDAETALKAIDHKLWDQLKRELHNEKIISDPIRRKLQVIGQHYGKLIRHAEHLPPRYNAIYQLTRLKEQALTKLVEERKLSPSLEDRDVAKLLPSPKQPSKRGETASAETLLPLLRVIQTKKRLSSDAKAALINSLKQLSRVDGIELRFTEDGERYSSQDEE